MHAHQGSGYCKNARVTGLINRVLYQALFSLLLLYSSCSAAQTQNMVLLENQQCDIQVNSVQAAKHPNANHEKQWVDIRLPDFWEDRWPGYSGSVWYKIQWTQQCHTPLDAPLAISIDSINMAGEVYLNDQLLWKDRSLVEPLSRSWNTPRYWIIPPSCIKSGENTLMVKVVGVATQSPGMGLFHIGSASLITQHQREYKFRHQTVHLISLIISLTLGGLGLLIWLLRRQDSTFAWFALASTLWAIFISNTQMSELGPFSNTLQLAKFNILILAMYSVCFAIFTWRFANKKYKQFEYLSAVIIVIFCLSLILSTTAYLQWIMSIIFFFSILLFLINCLFYQWIAYKSKQPDVRILACLMLLYIGILIHDIIKIINHDTSGFMTTPFAALLMTLALSLILGWRIAKNITKIEAFNEQLEIKIDQVKLELEQSLDKKHQLEIDNIRLQERLNLSHDLHDGLGGSLVRSIVLVDKSEQFDKHRTLSILKLLRNDLRQIIDSGSSLGAKIPETPLIWGAPLRHRYVQIFEEMDITSKWSFPERWQLALTTMESLTLARVTEEALTNIVKHSRATEVNVSLAMIDAQTLELSIRDNGVGFDPSMVQSGFHVGLHSMQVRVNRIGASIDILSQPGQTEIRVLIRHQPPDQSESL
ncbi:signal transduction histidine kinase [Acinetobacter calcoaceticus]|uniref:histidine kinase n=1 Tax=Acinetobacter calcoaceticus TaxID=471 RepID=A0A4R1XQR6_ACICA|nr:signal transduction histidine kinase [Acinetobacter calcoaceticus]